MGSPLTVALAEFQVTNIESLALASSADPPSLYKHFVDDGISRHRDRQHAESLEHSNSLSDDLVYTIEHPALDGTLPFLDILLHPHLSTSVYRKPTHTDSYTHYSTSSPQSTKDSIISFNQSLAVPMTSAPRSIFSMNLNIFALFFSITVIPFHALNLSCAEPSTHTVK